MVTGESWDSRISRHIAANGSVLVPPRIARWLESKAGVTAEWRISLRGTDFEAYEVLLAMHMAALRSGCGTDSPVGQREQSPLEAWMSTKEAAAEMQVSDRCVRKWIHTGRLPATMSGARWLINRNDLGVHNLTR